jgi:hypothetical protein
MPIFAWPISRHSFHSLRFTNCDSILPQYRRYDIIGGYYSQQLSSKSQRIQSRFPPDSITHYIIQRRSDLVTLYTTPHASGRGDAISTSVTERQHRGGREVRNLFVGRRSMAVVGIGMQPRLQAKSISVALPTATQTPKPMFLVQPRSPSYQATQTPFPLFPCCTPL